MGRLMTVTPTPGTARVRQEGDDLLSSLSHDLRAPMRAIEGFAAALNEDCADQLDQTGRDYLEDISQATRQMRDMLNAILALSRLGQIGLNIADVNLTAMAHEIAVELHGRDPGRAIEFVVDEGLHCRADATLMRQALICLLDNAWKFTADQTSGQVRVMRLPGEEGPDTDVFAVTDNGIGFDRGASASLFQLFHTLHSRRQGAGLGTGLAVVRKVIERHGGYVQACPGSEAGATFTLALPRGAP